MASSYTHIRCPGCDGTLEYKKDKKIWECIYCGNEIRREEKYDGLYTIKNVVRQVLVDLAYGRMDNARKNLVESEKISSDYAGTIIARLSLEVFRLITPGAYKPNEKKTLFSQIKRNYERLNTLDSGISTEEEGLYESFQEYQDAFGVLVVVFDLIHAEAHLQFVLNLIQPSKIYSADLNEKLLNYAFKNDNTEMVDQILGNDENIHCRQALFSLLNHYADGERKRSYLPALIQKAELKNEDRGILEEYILSSEDSLDTKILLYSESVEYRVAPSIQSIQKAVFNNPDITEEQIRTVVQSFGLAKPKDTELYQLIEFAYCQHTGTVAICEMQELIESDLYIKLSDKTVRMMLSRKNLSLEEKLNLLEMAQSCHLDRKAKDNIVADILLKDRSDYDSRIQLIQKMLSYVDNISTGVVSEYILRCNIDADRKPDVLEEMLKLDLNMNYFQDVLNQYLKSNVDSPDVKEKVASLLGGQGISADGSALLDIAYKAGGNYQNSITFIQNAIRNGARVQDNSMSRYLENVQWDYYHTEVMQLFDTPSAQISDFALGRYVLMAPEESGMKLHNALYLAQKNGASFGTIRCEITHLNHRVNCNLFQAYVLLCPDSASVAESMTNAMKNAKAKLNAVMQVDGSAVKFKNYITGNRRNLSENTLNLCEKNNVFSLFF